MPEAKLPTFREMIRAAAVFLEETKVCPKHDLEHTGKRAYLLDFYSYLNEIEKGKAFIGHLLGTITDDGAAKVFYPGRINQRNMSTNAIDCGAAVDCIARFVRSHSDVFTAEERTRIITAIGEVADSYLRSASTKKPVTNQRLWALTGLVSYARLHGDDVRTIVIGSTELAFREMFVDGFFRYYPHASAHNTPDTYDQFTTFYQSRHTGFIRYAFSELGMSTAAYEEQLKKSEAALLAMYRADGTKDLRFECKRWYWLTPYEVASHSFDAYTLAFSQIPEAKPALHNVLYQIRRHFYGGYLHSHPHGEINFQCPTFWTAHLAWLTRIPNIEELFNAADAVVPFSYRFDGIEVFTDTTPVRRILVNRRFDLRNPTTGIFENGLPQHVRWVSRMPAVAPGIIFSFRENANQALYALRGHSYYESWLRLYRFLRECLVMLLPRYSTGYGAVQSMECDPAKITVRVRPATKYGTLLDTEYTVELTL